jgi:hypothetical protein
MGKTLFQSTLAEKAALLDKLKDAPSHKDVATAIRVVEDSKTLHEMHKVLSDVRYNLLSLVNCRDPNLIGMYINSCNITIADFYANIDKKKTRAKTKKGKTP